MATIKPFKGLRPPQNLAQTLACLPYDVMDSAEATQMALGKPESLLHITRAEIDCPAGTDIHSETVYNKAVDNFNMFKTNGWLIPDTDAKYYLRANNERSYSIRNCWCCRL